MIALSTWIAVAICLPAPSVSAFWPFSNDGLTQDSAPVVANFASITDQYVMPVYVPTPVKPVIDFSLTTRTGLVYVPGEENTYGAGQCVLWVRYVTHTTFSGDAGSWSRFINNGKIAEVGEIVVLNSSKRGHVGVVIGVDKLKGTVTVRSRNYRGLWLVSDDTFDIDNVAIVGYIKL